MCWFWSCGTDSDSEKWLSELVMIFFFVLLVNLSCINWCFCQAETPLKISWFTTAYTLFSYVYLLDRSCFLEPLAVNFISRVRFTPAVFKVTLLVMYSFDWFTKCVNLCRFSIKVPWLEKIPINVMLAKWKKMSQLYVSRFGNHLPYVLPVIILAWLSILGIKNRNDGFTNLWCYKYHAVRFC